MPSAMPHAGHVKPNPYERYEIARVGRSRTAAMDGAVRRRSWSMQRRWVASLGIGVAAIVLIWLWVSSMLSARTLTAPGTSIATGKAYSGVSRDLTPNLGEVTPHDTVVLDALEGGQVAQVFVRAGEMVHAGQPLLRFRNTQLELDVFDREGRLVESITQLQAYEKQLEDTRLANEKGVAEIRYNIIRLTRAAERNDALVSKGFATLQSRDQIQDELAYQTRLQSLQIESSTRQDALRVAQLPRIEAELGALRRSLQITRAKLDNLLVRAPAAGRVTDIVQNIGETRNRGERVGEIVPDRGY